VAVVDPFGTTDGTGAAIYRAAFNPLDAVVQSREPVDTAALIADALIVQESGPGSHFTMAARNLLHGLILWFAVYGPRNAADGYARGSLLDVRDALTGVEKPLKTLLHDMVDMGACGGHEADPAIGQSAQSFLDKPENEAGSVLSTAHEHTAFLASPQIREAVAQSSFNLAGLRWRATGAAAPLSLYIALPARYLSTHGRLMRLMVTLACTAVEAAGEFDSGREGPRVLACLDEFPVLGHLAVIESAAGYMAGFGLILWPVLQDLGQLKRHYREGWETFLGNAGLVQAFGNTDATTLEYLQKRLGDRAILTENISTQGLQVNQTSVSHGIQTMPLLRAEEIARTFSRGSARQLVLPAGRRPIIAARTPWPAEKTLHRMIAG
jgi:Type IV secretory pathway, VirD4 components